MKDKIKIFSPATVSNVCCGFDVLGFAINGIGDELTISKSQSSGVKIKDINGFTVPKEVDKNTATIAANAMLNNLGINDGFDLVINKKIKPGSGIGSSAASAVGAVYGINELLDRPFEKNQLLKFAIKGEFISASNAPADNVASALYGGLVLVNNKEDYRVTKLPAPANLHAVIHHPLIEINTHTSRLSLPKSIKLNNVSNQLASIAGFIHSLHTSDLELMKSSLKDYLVEKNRSIYVPIFDKVKKVAELNNALCCSISGSGPSIFSLVSSINQAQKLKTLIDKEYINEKVKFNSYITSLRSKGVREI